MASFRRYGWGSAETNPVHKVRSDNHGARKLHTKTQKVPAEVMLSHLLRMPTNTFVYSTDDKLPCLHELTKGVARLSIISQCVANRLSYLSVFRTFRRHHMCKQRTVQLQENHLLPNMEAGSNFKYTRSNSCIAICC